MERISENLRNISLKGFIPTGYLFDDVRQLSLLNNKNIDKMPKGMPIVLGLRISLGDPLTVHVLTEAVCKKIQNVKIENLPTEYPVFLSKPFFIEAKPGNVLFDNIDAIGGFIENDDLLLIMWANNGTYFTKTKNPFNGIRLENMEYIPIQGSFIPQADQNRNVFPFITILALMLEAEKTPILIDHGKKKSQKRNQKQNKKKQLSDWIECRVYIDAKFKSKPSKNSNPMSKDGKEKQDVFVHDFLRFQAYGPEHSLRKWIYIDGHDSTRWKKTGDRKITLDTHFK